MKWYWNLIDLILCILHIYIYIYINIYYIYIHINIYYIYYIYIIYILYIILYITYIHLGSIYICIFAYFYIGQSFKEVNLAGNKNCLTLVVKAKSFKAFLIVLWM